MIRIAICEDSAEDAAAIRSLIVRHLPFGPQCDIRHFSQGRYLLSAYEDSARPFDILLLDIEMPGMDGFELAGRLRQRDPNAVIVFITVHGERRYLRGGYRYRPHGYLLKPLCASQFHEVLDEALASLHRAGERCLTHRTRTGVLTIPYAEIIRLEMERNTLCIVTGERVHRVRQPLRSLKKDLLTNGFAQVRRGCMVNLVHVRRLDAPARELELSNGERVPVSRSEVRSVAEQLLALRGWGR